VTINLKLLAMSASVILTTLPLRITMRIKPMPIRLTESVI
jgi:hypothetical protein